MSDKEELLTKRICVRVTDDEYWFLKKRGASGYVRKLIRWAMKCVAKKKKEKAAEKAAA